MLLSIKTKLIEVLPFLLKSKLDGIKAIYLFGSHASGLVTEESDIDIAILMGKKIAPVQRWQIESELANELSSDVDLVDLLNASTVMQNQIIQQGICIYDDDNSACFFEIQVMSMYQHLNEERADILKQYMRS
jgi:predicted nucleotidyltransferase